MPAPSKLRLLLSVLALVPALLFAQSGNVRGFIYDAETGEPSIFTPVALISGERTLGAQTDVNGFFSFTRLAPGSYTIRVIYLGYDTLSQTVAVTDRIVNEKLYLKKSSTTMQPVMVTATRREATEQVRVGVTTLTPKQIERLPTIGGQADIAQYMQVVPGVVFTGDQGGQLYIRGGSPIQNLVQMDGMTLYNPFHSLGLFSVFDNDIIRNADIYTAAFPAQYGGRVSSVMDITTRDGNKNRLSGKVSASTFAAKALLEGPLKKPAKPGGGGSSFLVNYKRSYLDQTSKSLYEGLVGKEGLPFRFDDLYGKISLNAANGSKVNFFGFNFNDGVRYRGVSDIEWNNWGAGTNFVLVPSESSTIIDGVFALSNYEIGMREDRLAPRTSSINSYNVGLNFKYFLGKDEMKYGINVAGVKTKFNYFNSLGYGLRQENVSTELAGHFNYRINAGKFVIDPGVRAQYYASLSVMSIEPRMGLKFNATEKVRFKAAGGFFSQNLMAANNDRDVVNLFYGFLTAAEDIPRSMPEPDGSVRTIKDPVQRGKHAVVGVELDLIEGMTVNLEGYIKEFGQVTNLNRDKLYNDTPEFISKPDQLKKDYILETGIAKGGDMLLKYERKKAYFWFVYSLNFVERWDGMRTYNPIWDRRHNVNLVASYEFGKFDSWKVSARWNYGSGFPFTQNQGMYARLPFNNGVGSDITSANGDLAIIYADLNGGRLPSYHRLDVGVTKIWRLSDRQEIQADLSVTNGYDRRNIFYRDRISGARVDQLPFLPSFGLSYTF